MGKERHKRKNTYTILLVPNRADGKARNYRLSHLLIPTVLLLVLCLSVITIGSVYVIGQAGNGSAKVLQMNFRNLSKQEEGNEDLQEEIEVLRQENKNLQEQITVLSSAVSQKSDRLETLEAENEARIMPTGFPLNGNATISFQGSLTDYLQGDTEEVQEQEEPAEEVGAEEEEQVEEQPQTDLDVEQEDPIIVFEASEGVLVVATGYGIVTSIEEDENFGYRVVVDHGNGYCSVYLNETTVKVKEGAEVARGTAIFELEEVQKVGYQIELDAKCVDPLSVMEIAG